MTYRIWEDIDLGDTINPVDGCPAKLTCSSTYCKCETFDQAVQKLKELEENGFNYSKYRRKKVLDIRRESDTEVVVEMEDGIRRYYISPKG